jgi:hypothetical protein
MNVRWLMVAGVGEVFFVRGGSAAAFGNEAGPANRGATSALVEGPLPSLMKFHSWDCAISLRMQCRRKFQWTVPEIQVPVRVNYSVNILRLNRFLQLPDGSLLYAHNKLFAFGWALRTLF